MSHTKILVVEDQAIVAKEIEHRLTTLGYKVPAVALSGEEAIRRAARFRPDLVLMDIVLQTEMDGVEAANRIRAQFGIPVVYLTAHADTGTLQRAKLTEPLGYILKPFTEAELRATIEMALYRHEAEERLRRSEAKHRLVLDSIDFPILALKEDMTILYCNDASAALLGKSVVELEGEDLLALFPEFTRTKLYIDCLDVLGTGKARHTADRICDRYFYACVYPAPGGILVVGGDITEHKRAEEERERLIRELEESLSGTKRLSGTLPICSHCHKICDEKGNWHQLEVYLWDHSEADFSHSICPECGGRLFPDLLGDEQGEGRPDVEH